MTTCLSLWRVEWVELESSNDGVTVSRHAAGLPGSHLQDLPEREKVPQPHRITRRGPSKRREWEGLDVENCPLCLHLGDVKNPENVRGENVDEIVNSTIG